MEDSVENLASIVVAPKRKRDSENESQENVENHQGLNHEDSSSEEDEELHESHAPYDNGNEVLNGNLTAIHEVVLEDHKTRGRKKKSFVHISDPKKVTVEQRIREFQGEPFSNQNGNLYCDCCCSILPRKFSSIKNHIKSKSHLKKRELAGYIEHSVIYHQIMTTERHRQSGNIQGEGVHSNLPHSSFMNGSEILDETGLLTLEQHREGGIGSTRLRIFPNLSLVSMETENDYTKDIVHLSFEHLMERASLLVARNEEIMDQIRSFNGKARCYQYTLTTYVIPSSVPLSSNSPPSSSSPSSSSPSPLSFPTTLESVSPDGLISLSSHSINSSFPLRHHHQLSSPDVSFRFGVREQLVEMDVLHFKFTWKPQYSFPKFLFVPDHFQDNLSFEFSSYDGLCTLTAEIVRSLQKINLLDSRPLGDVRRLVWALQLVQQHLLDVLSHFIISSGSTSSSSSSSSSSSTSSSTSSSSPSTTTTPTTTDPTSSSSSSSSSTSSSISTSGGGGGENVVDEHSSPIMNVPFASRLSEIEESLLPLNYFLNQFLSSHGISIPPTLHSPVISNNNNLPFSTTPLTTSSSSSPSSPSSLSITTLSSSSSLTSSPSSFPEGVSNLLSQTALLHSVTSTPILPPLSSTRATLTLPSLSSLPISKDTA